jgi:uncharacterized protein
VRRAFLTPLVTAAIAAAATIILPAQRGGQLTDEARAERWRVENELASIAIIERKVMIPMRDGVRIAADIYRPKDASKKYPAIWVRTPYNFNFWDVANGVPRNMSTALTAVKNGYAFVEMQERGQFFAEGEWDVLGAPLTDTDDEVRWMTTRPWSNGRVGATGCSSTAEWQLAAVARNVPGFASFNAQGFGCGVGRIGPYYEQGNWYRGGVFMMYNLTWFYDNQKPDRPMFPRNTSQEELIRLSKGWDLAMRLPRVDWNKAYWHLPLQDIIRAAGGPRGVFADAMPVATGGRMIQRTPNDPAWYKGALYHDDMRINVPGLWYTSLYDIALAPNLELYNLVRKTAKGKAANQQWLIIAPVGHCAFNASSERTIVGERDMGDARLSYQEIMYSFFDLTLKGQTNETIESQPNVRYYTMGNNKWNSSDVWPPRGATPVTYYLASGGNANTLNGDGRLTLTRPADRGTPDRFAYDPMDPVPTLGGYRVGSDPDGRGGSFDQRTIEARKDVLVYTTEPFTEGTEVAGPITPVLYVSSDVKDTDFTVKIVDVAPDGRAFNLDESIQRMRYRDGYDKPPVWMEKDKVYKVALQPLVTSNYFLPGHRLRVEVSSSSFPRFERNLNTGGRNYDEVNGIVAQSAVHHSAESPSSVTITVVRK